MREHLNAITARTIAAAVHVHRELGPGLLESAYDACLAFELIERGIAFQRQKSLPLIYRGHVVDCAYRLDFVVEDAVVVEVKSIEKVLRVHCSQLLSYLRLSGYKVGLLINFNVKRLVQDGLRRIVNGFPD